MKSQKKPAASLKDTIYIDIEDEITAIIDKLHKSEAKVVALVLPKRAATLQSVVNLKLLKRAAENVKKNLVLITNDHSVLPLAGAVGLHVAKTLQSKPAIPQVAKTDEEAITVDSEVDGTEAADEPEIDPKTPIGVLVADDDDTIDVDEDTTDKTAASAVPAKANKSRKLKVPNFDKFRTKLLLGGAALLLLIVGWVFASIVLPKATITIATDTSHVNTSLSLEAKNDIQDADLEKNIAPAYKKELKKSSVEKVPTTGKRDDGAKATGTMTLTNCIKDDEGFTVPAGTIFSSGGLNFVTTAAVSLEGAIYQGSSCKSANFGKSETVPVVAEAGGSRYNLSARAYSPPGQYVTSQGSMTAAGSDMAGGTSKLVSIVAQSDIDGAKQQALDKLSEATRAEFKKTFQTDQSIALEGSLENQPPAAVATPEVGKEASEVEVKVDVTFSTYGIKRDILIQALEKEIKKSIDNDKQVVQNTGIDQADIRVLDKPAAGIFRISLQTAAVAGPQLDTEGIKREIAGKKKNQTKEIISSRPGITDVKVNYSPFWVASNPKNPKKITINFTESNADKK